MKADFFLLKIREVKVREPIISLVCDIVIKVEQRLPYILKKRRVVIYGTIVRKQQI